jgi:hypothetical protein
LCGTIVSAGIRPEKIVTKVREVTYLNSEEQSRYRFDRDEMPMEWKTKGREIVEEVFACPSCAKHAGEPEVFGQATRTWVKPRPKEEKRRRKVYRD